MKPRSWYRFAVNAEADRSVANLRIFDVIGKSFLDEDAVTAEKFVADLDGLPDSVKTIRVSVNSPGGSVWDALAIANALRAQSSEKGRAVEARIEGLAASAATLVTSAADKIEIYDNARVMIHDPAAIVLGPAAAMRKMAEMLDGVKDAIVATYRKHSQLAADEISALMEKTTWMGAADAVKNGFATAVIPAEPVEACWRPEAVRMLGEIPDAVRAHVNALVAKPAPVPPSPAPADPKLVVRACKEAGLPELADDLLGQPMEQVTARLEAAKAQRAAAEARAREITAACALAKQPELAEGYIRGGMSVADVKAHLTTITAKLDKVEIEAHLKPDTSPAATARAALNPAQIYAERNQRAVPNGNGKS